MIVFDLTSKESFDHIPGWLEEISKYTSPTIFKLVLANKSDIESRKVSSEEIKDFEKKYDIAVLEVSAKTAINVDQAFKNTVTTLIQK